MRVALTFGAGGGGRWWAGEEPCPRGQPLAFMPVFSLTPLNWMPSRAQAG